MAYSFVLWHTIDRCDGLEVQIPTCRCCVVRDSTISYVSIYCRCFVSHCLDIVFLSINAGFALEIMRRLFQIESITQHCLVKEENRIHHDMFALRQRLKMFWLWQLAC